MSDLDKEIEEAVRKKTEENARVAAEMQQKSMEIQQKMMVLQQQAAGGMTPEIMQEMQKLQQEMMAAAMGAYSQQVADYYDDDEEDNEEEKAEFIAAHPQPEGMSKYLALGSFFTIMRDEPLETLEMMGDADDYVEEMEDSWGIDDRDSLIEMLESLLAGRAYNSYNDTYLALKAGKFDNIDEDDIESYQDAFEVLRDAVDISPKDINACPSIIGWDIERAAYLTRTGAHAEYITKEEAWAYLKRAAEKTTENFKDWTQYAVSIVMGRAVHMGYHEMYIYAAQALLIEAPEFLNERPISSF